MIFKYGAMIQKVDQLHLWITIREQRGKSYILHGVRLLRRIRHHPPGVFQNLISTLPYPTGGWCLGLLEEIFLVFFGFPLHESLKDLNVLRSFESSSLLNG